jgi:hypothetical protein
VLTLAEHRRPGRPNKSGLTKKNYSLTLTRRAEQIAYLMGGSNRSHGVELLFSGLPVFYAVKSAIAHAAAGNAIAQEWAQALLEELEALKIDRVYEEAAAAGLMDGTFAPTLDRAKK